MSVLYALPLQSDIVGQLLDQHANPTLLNCNLDRPSGNEPSFWRNGATPHHHSCRTKLPLQSHWYSPNKLLPHHWGNQEQPLHLGIQLTYRTSQPSQEHIHLWKSETSIPAVLMRLISQMKTMHIKRVFIKMLQGLWPVIEISRNYLLLVKK